MRGMAQCQLLGKLGDFMANQPQVLGVKKEVGELGRNIQHRIIYLFVSRRRVEGGLEWRGAQDRGGIPGIRGIVWVT